MGDRGCQFDMAHALPANLGPGDLHTAAVTNYALVANALVLAAMAFPVLLGTEDFFAKQAFPFGLESSIVDSFRFLDLTPGPGPNLLRRGQTNPQGIEIVDIQQGISPF